MTVVILDVERFEKKKLETEVEIHKLMKSLTGYLDKDKEKIGALSYLHTELSKLQEIAPYIDKIKRLEAKVKRLEKETGRSDSRQISMFSEQESEQEDD